MVRLVAILLLLAALLGGVFYISPSVDVSAQEPQELIEKRTRTSKTYSLGGDKYALDVSIGSIHYKDNPENSGELWKEIDNTFVPAAAPWDWEMLKAGYHTRVKEDFTAGQIIEFERYGETVQFQPMALEWTNNLDQIQQVSMPQQSTPVITGNSIKWDNAYGEGIDFEWQNDPARLIKILQIENFSQLPAPMQYIVDGGNPVLRLNLIFAPSQGLDMYVDGGLWDKQTKVQTFNNIRFMAKTGGSLWEFSPLLYWDSGEGDREQSVATLERRGTKLYVSIRVPFSWLAGATYPVYIDQTVEIFPNGYRYFHVDAWNGDLKWLTSEPDGGSPSNSFASMGALGDKLIQGFQSEPLNYDSLSAGHWGFYLWGRKNDVVPMGKLFVEVRKNTSAGELIATSIYTPELTTTETEHYCYLDFPETAWAPGDTLWIGVYVNVTVKKGGKRAYFYYDHDSRLSRTVDPTVDEQVGASADDGFIILPATIDKTNAYNYIGEGASSNVYHSWYRFDGITIAQSATIDVAYITIRVGVVNSPLTKIYADDQNDPAAPNTAGDYLGRTPTTEGVDWDIAGASGYKNSPSIVAVIQELVNSYDYSNEAILILHKNDSSPANNYAYGASWDNETYDPPAIHIEYTAGGGVVAPTVVTNAATSVEETTATLSGNITATGGENCTHRGFQWDIDTGVPYAANWTESGNFGVSQFTHGITGLTKGELYYYRAGANNTAGWGFGAEDTFLTKPDEPNTLVATGLTQQINLTWNNGTGADNTTITAKLGSYPANRADGAVIYDNTGTSCNHTGLGDGEQWYYRAWSWCTEGGKVQYSDTYAQAAARTSGTPIPPSVVIPGRVAPAVGIEHIAWFIPLFLFSLMAFWTGHGLFFMLAGGNSLMIGFRWFDLFATNIGLSMGLLLIAYSLVCLGFAVGCLFWKGKPSEE